MVAQLAEEVNFHSNESEAEKPGGATTDKLLKVIQLMFNLNPDKKT